MVRRELHFNINMFYNTKSITTFHVNVVIINSSNIYFISSDFVQKS